MEPDDSRIDREARLIIETLVAAQQRDSDGVEKAISALLDEYGWEGGMDVVFAVLVLTVGVLEWTERPRPPLISMN